MSPKDVRSKVEPLVGLDIDALRGVWRETFGEPPKVRSADFLRRLLAEQIQIEAFGRDLDLERELDRLAKSYRPGKAKAAPKSRFKAGTVLVREWQGEAHRVEVTTDGFLWRGARHKSLSAIAREITGVRWNGPRFFGLRDAEQAAA